MPQRPSRLGRPVRAAPGRGRADDGVRQPRPRAKRATDVLAEQVAGAVALRPDFVSLWAGGNDILQPLLDPDDVLAPMDAAVTQLSASGARVVLLTGFGLTGWPVLGVLPRRVVALNEGLREIAQGHGAALVGVSDPHAWADRELWAPDRVHPSPWSTPGSLTRWPVLFVCRWTGSGRPAP